MLALFRRPASPCGFVSAAPQAGAGQIRDRHVQGKGQLGRANLLLGALSILDLTALLRLLEEPAAIAAEEDGPRASVVAQRKRFALRGLAG